MSCLHKENEMEIDQSQGGRFERLENAAVAGEYGSGIHNLWVHGAATCTPPCAIHAPSDHPLRDAPKVFRSDKAFLIERQCEHGVGHPDPDSVRFLEQTTGESWYGVHGCDGCCRSTDSDLGEGGGV